jgi:hypothetical protein
MSLTRVLSYDVGMRNLAYCLVSEDKSNGPDNRNWQIEAWDVVDVITHFRLGKLFKELSLEEINIHTTRYLFQNVDALLGDISTNPIHHLVIELQPGKSRETEAIANSICTFYYSWFLQKQKEDPAVIVPKPKFYSATLKLNVLSGELPLHFFNAVCGKAKRKMISLEEYMNSDVLDDDCEIMIDPTGLEKKSKSSQYIQNKSDAVYETEVILNSCTGLKKWKQVYDEVKTRRTWNGKKQKMDDLADAFLQAIHFLWIHCFKDPAGPTRRKKAPTGKSESTPRKQTVIDKSDTTGSKRKRDKPDTKPSKRKRTTKKKKEIQVEEVEI